jgi:hypothetical protein
MRRPTKARIGWATWDIYWIPDEKWDEIGSEVAPDWSGGTIGTRHAIYMRVMKTMDEQYLRETLFHEIQHACWVMSNACNFWRHMSRNKMDEFEEMVIGASSGTLLAALQDSPGLRSYLFP